MAADDPDPQTALARHIVYVRPEELDGAERNPKGHHLPDIKAGVLLHGFTAPAVLDERTSRLVAGHGRRDAVAELEREHPLHPTRRVPDGIVLDAEGRWTMPVVRGWASRDDEHAAAMLVLDNRSTENGGWDDQLLAELLEELADYSADLLASTGFSQDDLDDLVRRASSDQHDHDREDEVARGSGLPAKRRETPLVIIFSNLAGGLNPESRIALRLGWQLGIATSHPSSAANLYRHFPRAHRLAFMDNEWKDYDHEAHLAALREFKPRYATTRDLLTREQAAEAGVDWYSVEDTLRMAEEVADCGVDNVILIPKYDCLARLPREVNGKRVVLGYSVPSSYGGTPMPIESMRGWPIHLLGGAWKSQRALLNLMGDDVVSLDNNNVLMISHYGQVNMPDGSTVRIDDLIGHHIERSMFPALALSFANIATAIIEQYGVELPPVPITDEEAEEAEAEPEAVATVARAVTV